MTIRVLIVDDEKDIPLALRDFLEDIGEMEALVAHSGEDGLRLLESEAVDVCVVDMRLPGMAGDDFILAAHGLRPDLRFLVHTGSVEYSLPRRLREIGIKGWMIVPKPVFTMRTFIDKILALMDPNHGEGGAP